MVVNLSTNRSFDLQLVWPMSKREGRRELAMAPAREEFHMTGSVGPPTALHGEGSNSVRVNGVRPGVASAGPARDIDRIPAIQVAAGGAMHVAAASIAFASQRGLHECIGTP